MTFYKLSLHIVENLLLYEWRLLLVRLFWDRIVFPRNFLWSYRHYFFNDISHSDKTVHSFICFFKNMYIIFTILAHYEFTLMFELDVTRRILRFWVCSKFDLKVDTTQHQIPSTLRRGNFLLIPYRIATQLYLIILY